MNLTITKTIEFDSQGLNRELNSKIDIILGKHKEVLKRAIMSSIRANRQVASGKLLSSISCEVKRNSNISSLGLSITGKAANYAMNLEYGRRAAFVPINRLVEWIKQKLSIGSITLRAGKLSRESRIRSFAFAISRSKKTHATKAKPFIKNIVTIEADKIYREIGDMYG